MIFWCNKLVEKALPWLAIPPTIGDDDPMWLNKTHTPLDPKKNATTNHNNCWKIMWQWTFQDVVRNIQSLDISKVICNKTITYNIIWHFPIRIWSISLGLLRHDWSHITTSNAKLNSNF
jgi:hypothetical protein